MSNKMKNVAAKTVQMPRNARQILFVLDSSNIHGGACFLPNASCFLKEQIALSNILFTTTQIEPFPIAAVSSLKKKKTKKQPKWSNQHHPTLQLNHGQHEVRGANPGSFKNPPITQSQPTVSFIHLYLGFCNCRLNQLEIMQYCSTYSLKKYAYTWTQAI